MLQTAIRIMMTALGWLVAAILALMLILFGLFKLHQTYHYIDLLPEKLGPVSIVAISGETHFREGCGAVVYKLSRRTADQIAAEGESFFHDAVKARGKEGSYYDHTGWTRGPIPPSQGDTGHPFWLPFHICTDLSPELMRKILALSENEDVFYSTRREAVTVVMPEERLIVLSYNG